jgi:hypothetical protein
MMSHLESQGASRDLSDLPDGVFRTNASWDARVLYPEIQRQTALIDGVGQRCSALVFHAPTEAILDEGCSAQTFSARGYAEARVGGLLRAAVKFTTNQTFPGTGDPQFWTIGGMDLSPNSETGSVAQADLGNAGAFDRQDPAAPPVATMQMDVRLDGNFMTNTGNFLSPSPLGPEHHNDVALGLFNTLDDWRQIQVDWAGVHIVSPNVSFEGKYYVSQIQPNIPSAFDLSRHPIDAGNSADLIVHFEKIPVGADGIVEYHLFFVTAADLVNRYNFEVTYAGAETSTAFMNTARITSVRAFDADGNDISSKYTFTLASGETIPTVTQGCGQGYWKNHASSWPATQAQSANFNAVFGVTWAAPNLTLGAALKLQGGQLNELARQGVAALLNAAHTGINSPYTVSQVIDLVRAKDAAALIAANALGCPLN